MLIDNYIPKLHILQNVYFWLTHHIFSPILSTNNRCKRKQKFSKAFFPIFKIKTNITKHWLKIFVKKNRWKHVMSRSFVRNCHESRNSFIWLKNKLIWQFGNESWELVAIGSLEQNLRIELCLVQVFLQTVARLFLVYLK